MNFRINQNRLVKTFMDMVSIDSESGNEARFAEYMLKSAKGLALKTSKDSYGNIYLSLEGGGEPLMINTHMDTVSPGVGIKPKVSGNYIVSDGKTVLGADSKAGIAAMIESVRILEEQNIKHRSLLITLTCNEESGIPTADKVQTGVRVCVVPDRGAPVGEIITGAPHAQVFEISVKGKTAYATTNFDDGIHAIKAAAELINLLPIGNIDNDTTVNIGKIQGGSMTTMIPDECILKGNCYSFTRESFDNFFKTLRHSVSKIDKKYGTKTKVEMLEYFGGYDISRNDHLVLSVRRAIEEVGIKPEFKNYKAVSNANLLNQIGIKTVLISTGVENQHTTKERISIYSLEKLTSILVNLLRA